MKSPKVAFVLFFVALVILYWTQNRVEESAIVESPAEASPEASVTPKPMAAPSPSATPITQVPQQGAEPKAEILTQTPARPAAAVSGAKPPRPPPGGISYTREGNLIVVFGDVLYGKLINDDGSPTGFVRVKPVETWDGPIPFHISPNLKNPERVLKTLQLFMEKTPVRFVPFNGQPNAIVFEPGDNDCRSYLGRIGGHQPIFLDDDCGVKEVSHEIMHALGFIHEHSRPDRDRFVRILWDAIEPENVRQFEIAPDEMTRLSVSRPFDYKSVMMYDSTLFAKVPGQKTIESLTNEPIEPSVEGLSREDIERIYRVY